MSLFIGSGVAVVTPFNENGIDFKKLEELLNWHVENNTDAIVICGTTGEGSTMTDEEKKKAIQTTVEIINKRIPVVAGVGTNNTLKTLELSKFSKEVGADALLVITPYYNKTSKKGLYEHFKIINDQVNLPIMAYNVPSRTGMNITPEDLLNLSTLKNITSIKEASGNISQAILYRKLCPQIDLYSGNDDQIVALMSIGAKGTISVAANILPKVIHDMTHHYINGKTNEALELQLKYLDFINSLFIETNPIPIKTALNLIGKNVGNLRLPLVDMEEKNLDILKNEMRKINLI
ncbi:4-hydroxy-tetrahydrodipicolinate synthase [Candidatus Arthromitus sp. SFB-turkey]|uniref:4-hydroxy-tetrahydrodipicolinate synthase n=1 Tax=Candidatus Arthromitus sp. SFB-turkey TaxID=1840217 RepID=UPI0007F44D5B|nr:4-hydroxy-tetrahydrodipicolinate synthase [Candidatus Arthromitus sp. SFB-turkey]OAT88053.1 4-hydroxy-tetrahydrodipicolinate synthase [Candidatus Arthromitus sp. SFB-turkey]